MMSLFQTYVNVRSVSLSMSCFISDLSTIIFMDDGSFYVSHTASIFYNNFPYIISYLSPSFSSTFILVKLDVKKKIITVEQLIGYSCGFVSLLFIILSIIIFAVRKAKKNNYMINQKSVFSTDEELDVSQTSNQMNNNLIKIDINSMQNENIDNWL